MKNSVRLLIIGIIFLTTACSDNSSAKNEMTVGEFTTIEVQKVYDMGTVAKGAMINTDVEIKNTGSYPLVIADIKAACSCTVSDYEEDPIQPGESTIVKATIDTDRLNKGVVSKPISITANTKPSVTKVVIKARID